jgi:hypothetical protein
MAQRHSDNTVSLHPRRVLVWGKEGQKYHQRFVSVCKGKITDHQAECRLETSLSLLTVVDRHPILVDIEVRRLDRDKFARAFARFWDVPV